MAVPFRFTQERLFGQAQLRRGGRDGEQNRGGHASPVPLRFALGLQDLVQLPARRIEPGDEGGSRAIRDALSFATSSSDSEAEAILERMKARRFVREAPGKGWELSPAGLEVLI